ncbi:MAG: hypothetical protein DI536_00130 [Archangium gephyra]|uniref:Uncharacterized protein n=1 Tax=Archangium gephyra TaxID=48 RepID=A0A2W5TRX1_9BACT|nr:MAG: hypothetical protein DI536_00130 [Archangium gephyra]
MALPPASLTSAGRLFTVLERAGQATCLALPCILAAQFDGSRLDAWLSIAGYSAFWLRSFLAARRFALRFERFVPMAVVPVLAFGFAAIAARSWQLGIGHVTNAVAAYYGARPHP